MGLSHVVGNHQVVEVEEVKKLLIVAAAATLFVLILAGLVGVYFTPRLKAELENLLTQRSGRPVRIESFGWSLWPNLQFKGRGLRIGSSEDFNCGSLENQFLENDGTCRIKFRVLQGNGDRL